MEVSLGQILEARERRVRRQNQLLAEYGKPLICFTMNIAGPEKYNALVGLGFHLGCRRLEEALADIKCLYSGKETADTGCEAYYVLDAAPRHLKAIACKIDREEKQARIARRERIAEKLAKGAPKA